MNKEKEKPILLNKNNNNLYSIILYINICTCVLAIDLFIL